MTRIQLEHFKEQMDAAVQDNSSGWALRLIDLLTKWDVANLLPIEWSYGDLRNLWRDNPEAAHVLADTHFLTKSR